MKQEIIEKFSDGVRLIMLTQRSKEGGKVTRPDRVAKKRITTNGADFLKAFEEFKLEKDNAWGMTKLPLRIYSSVNQRDLQKGIREFKMRQLEADYYDPKSRDEFYLDVKNRWISCLMKPSSRLETKFLIDIDDKAGLQNALEFIALKGIEIIAQYETKNGHHIITQPFNPSNWDSELGEIHKDGLMLLDF